MTTLTSSPASSTHRGTLGFSALFAASIGVIVGQLGMVSLLQGVGIGGAGFFVALLIAFALALANAAAYAEMALMMPNAKIMPPNVASVSGIDNILDYYKGTLADELDFEFTRETSAEAGGMADAEGGYKVRNNTNGEYIETGKWMAVFVNADGAWRVARLMTNTDSPVAAPTVEVEEGEAAAE